VDAGKKAIPAGDLIESGRSQTARENPRTDQLRVLVKRAALHSAHGQGIERIVLIHHEEAARRQDSLQLSQQGAMQSPLDVVEDAAGECAIESAVRERQARAIECHKGNISSKSCRTDSEAA
jgi:hypothetical protein